MAAQDKDGKGLIEGVPADYELDSLASTDFKFSAFAVMDPSMDSFVENKLYENAGKYFNA